MRLDWLTCLDDRDAAGFFYAAQGLVALIGVLIW